MNNKPNISQNVLVIPQLDTSFGQKNNKFNATKLYNASPNKKK